MSTTSLTAGEVMDKSASLMNDTFKTVYTHTVQLPYLQMALDELQEGFELYNIPITSQTSVEIAVNANVTSINPTLGYGAGAAPNYPVDLVEIQQLWEKTAGLSEPFIPVNKVEYLPHQLNGTQIPEIGNWAFSGQRIIFRPPSSNRTVKLDYIAKLFPDLITPTTTLGIINARSFLYYRTAALCSQFIGENPTRATELNNFAQMALDRSLGISIKGKQSIQVRRRPFMSSYKRRSVQ